MFEREGMQLRLEPHPDDFVEDGKVAVDMVRGIDSPLVSFLYCAPHTFHMGGDMTGIMEYAGRPADPPAHRRLLRHPGLLGPALHRQPARLDRPDPPAPRHRPGRGRLGRVLRDARAARLRRHRHRLRLRLGGPRPRVQPVHARADREVHWGRDEPRRAGCTRGPDRRADRRRPLPRADRGAAVGGHDVRHGRSVAPPPTSRWGRPGWGAASPYSPRSGRTRSATFVREALAGFGVDASYVGTAEDLLTPVVFCALDPPEDPPLLFYRLPVAPDLTLTKDDVPWDLVRDVPLLWVTGTGVSTEPARQTQLDMLAHRGRPDAATGRWTVLDLDWRPMFWPSPAGRPPRVRRDARARERRGRQPGRGRGGRRHVRPGGGRPAAARPRGRAGAGQEGRRGRPGRDPRRDAHRRAAAGRGGVRARRG